MKRKQKFNITITLKSQRNRKTKFRTNFLCNFRRDSLSAGLRQFAGRSRIILAAPTSLYTIFFPRIKRNKYLNILLYYLLWSGRQNHREGVLEWYIKYNIIGKDS